MNLKICAIRVIRGLSLAALLLLALGFSLPSRLLSLYHQEQGARALTRALAAGTDEEESPLASPAPRPLTRPEARAGAAGALARFRAAVEADPANAQAHRWLGRTALLLDRPEEATPAFSTAVRLRPDNPLPWWELGLAYERLASPLPLGGRDRPGEEEPVASAMEPSQPILIDRTSPPPRRIPAANVEVPSVASGAGTPIPMWGYARWLMPDAPGGWPGWWVPDEPVPRTVLFAAVPATVTFRVSLPVTPTALVFWMGMDPVLQAPLGDGVVYRVWVEGGEVFSRTLRPEEAREGWWPARADLTPWAGRTVRLTLTLDPGPAGDTGGDWAGWGDVQLVEAESALCALASCRDRAAAAWQEGGFTAQDFIAAGEAARKAQRYEEALGWYTRASILGTDVESTIWYTSFLSSNDWKALERSILTDRGWATPEMQFRAWFQWGVYLHNQQREAEAEVALQRAITLYPDSATLAPILSETYRFLGLSQWAQGKMAEALQSTKRAVELNESSTWAHIHYGKVLYLSNPNSADQTEREFDIALEQNPSVDIWRNLIGFWRWVGEIERANRLCERAQAVGLAAELDQECPDQ